MLGLGLVLLITLPIALKPECVPIEPDNIEVWHDHAIDKMCILIKHPMYKMYVIFSMEDSLFGCWETIYDFHTNDTFLILLTFQETWKNENLTVDLFNHKTSLSFWGFLLMEGMNITTDGDFSIQHSTRVYLNDTTQWTINLMPGMHSVILLKLMLEEES